MNQVVMEALKIMGVGMSGVFLVLVVFYIMVKALQIIFPYKQEEAQ